MTADRNPEKKAGETLPDLPEVFTMTDLEQIKVLADPLRLRILESLCLGERTTKQVAEKIGEKPTRLYHHVEALERVGLIRMTRTKQNRGTVEKYYLAVARSFKAGAGLFSGKDPDDVDTESLEQITATIFDNTAAELRRLITSGNAAGIEEEGVLSFTEVRADTETMERLQARFMNVLKEFEGECCKVDEDDEDQRRYRLTLAFFPLDRSES